MLSYEYRLDDEIRARDRALRSTSRPTPPSSRASGATACSALLSQELAAGLALELTGSFARATPTAPFSSRPSAPGRRGGRSDGQRLSGTLGYRLGSDWAARLTGGCSLSRTDATAGAARRAGAGQRRVRRRNAIFDLGARVDGSPLPLPGGPVRVALGVEGPARILLDDFETRDTQRSRVEQSRDVVAAFRGDSNSALLRRSIAAPGLERLILTAAGRYEHYDGSARASTRSSACSGRRCAASPSAPPTTPPFERRCSRRRPAPTTPSTFRAIRLHRSGAGDRGVGSCARRHQSRGRSGAVAQLDRRRGVRAADRARALDFSLNYYSIRFSDRIALPAPIITVVGDPAFELDRHRSTPTTISCASSLPARRSPLDLTGPASRNGNATPADVSVIVDDRSTTPP